MKSLFEKMIGVRVPCDYTWDDEGIVRIGAQRDIAAYAAGDLKGKCIIFLHGNGETATSEKYLFDRLTAHGERVFAGIASSRKEFVRVAHGGHNNFQFMMGYDKYVDKIVFFAKRK